MNEDIVLQLGQDALKTMAMISAPLLLSTLVIGLIVSIFQALTQINENTLTFVPKMIVIGIVLIFAGPWMIDVMKSYTINLIDSMSTIVRGP
jgi:flagellar biosynthetic protein FliQ